MRQHGGTQLNTQNSAATPPAFAGTVPYPASAQAWYLVFVLLLFYIFSFIDRQIISLLVEPIKRDLQCPTRRSACCKASLSRSSIHCSAFPSGGSPIAQNRKSIVAVGIVAWSLMATFCGLAKNWTQLCLARAGVGVGEAALSPAAYSMITDAFPREKQGRAFSVYNMGIAIGAGIAMLVGGLVVAAISGKARHSRCRYSAKSARGGFVFIVTGAPGLLLPLLLLGVREPARRGLIKMQSASGEDFGQKVPFREVLKFLVKHGNFYSLHFIALAMLAMVGYSVGVMVAHRDRSHLWRAGRAGRRRHRPLDHADQHHRHLPGRQALRLVGRARTNRCADQSLHGRGAGDAGDQLAHAVHADASRSHAWRSASPACPSMAMWPWARWRSIK